MRAMCRFSRTWKLVCSLAMSAVVATTVHADCYRYVSGMSTNPTIKNACVQELNITPIFVRLTDDGYDLLIPTPTQDTSAIAHKRATAAVQWLSEGSNLAATQAMVEDMLNNGSWNLGLPQIEQMNYALSTWLNTSGATSAIGGMAANSPGMEWGTSCEHIPICSLCQFYLCPDGVCNCYFYGGPDCCVIGKRMTPTIE